MKLKVLIVIATIGALAMAFVPLDIKSGTFSKDLVDLAHFPLMALTTLALFIVAERMPMGRKWQLALAAGTAIVIAVAIEYIQPSFSRTASRADIRVGLLGIFAACAGVELWRGQHRTFLRVIYVLAICAAAAIALRPLYYSWRARVHERRVGPHYPVFADFEHDHEINRWRIHGTKERVGSIAMVRDKASSGARSLRVRTPGHAWNSLGHSMRHRHWRGGKALAFDVFIGDDLSKLHVQFQDSDDRRFRGWMSVKPGWNTLQIPLTEVRDSKGVALNLDDMRYLTVSVPKGDDAHTYYIDNVRMIVDTAP